ncbi:MAG: amylo-alpha-1,6-glucosidase [Vicinamibacterales bacterium]
MSHGTPAQPDRSPAASLALLRRISPELPTTGELAPDTGREWLVTNGLGGYACGTVVGSMERRFHGLLVSALPAPLGRMMLLHYLSEELQAQDGQRVWLNAYGEGCELKQAAGSPYLTEFRLESGLPVWRYTLPTAVIERSVVMRHGENTVDITYRLDSGDAPFELALRPMLALRRHNAPLDEADGRQYRVTAHARGIDIDGGDDVPPLRMVLDEAEATFEEGLQEIRGVRYDVEARRGYDHVGCLTSPGTFRVRLEPGRCVSLTASTEAWDTVRAVTPGEAADRERRRRDALVQAADRAARGGAPAELVLAADQFVIVPATRPEEGDAGSARSVIAGYPWFTDWGRDTMISLEGLMLVTGRYESARQTLLTFARHVRDGLIPNLFPEGEHEGLYHTADATLWFFHALDRYERWTDDESLVADLLPVLEEIIARHVAGTRFGIHVEDDGLLSQGEEGYQLTWMDAKVDGWVVTPRRGKAVEINALWFNALCLVAGWVRRAGRESDADALEDRAAKARQSFNARFWSDARGHLLDVVDGPDGDDPACRPNQVLAIALPHPVLDQQRWQAVLDVVSRQLVTPRGLRSLSPDHPDYKPHYAGDLKTRDAAYHQGTVWSWLIGPYIDAWLAVHPDDTAGARAVLDPMLSQLDEGCIGTVSEIFDGAPPFSPRGCFAQAWGVAELLRALVRTEPADTPVDEGRSEGA